jgi:hypothetical protein
MIETYIRNLVIPTSSAIPTIASRFYIGSFPTSSVTYPASVMYPISRFNEMPDCDVRTERFQFSVYADYLSSASDIAESIKSQLKGYYGTPSTVYSIMKILFDNMSYMYDDQVLKYVKFLDMIIWYRGI